MYKIMMIEDDEAIAKILNRQLMRWGYHVYLASDFHNIIGEFESYKPDLVLLDISLPFYDGYHWCQEIRKISKTPIIFISSASDDMNLVMAINLGADDFVAKPFNLEVVTAKIAAILRRTYDFGTEISTLHCGNVILDIGKSILSYRDQTLYLTKNELKILEILFENKGQTVSRDRMMKHLWETESFIDDNTLTVNINRLRRKLDSLGLSSLIVTKKGLGYLVEVFS